MAQGEATPHDLRRALDGHAVGRSFDTTCPSCGREHGPGDRLVARTEREAGTDQWGVPSVVCAGCGRRSLADDERRPGVDQVLVSVDLVAAPMALVMDGESARVLDRSPAAGT